MRLAHALVPLVALGCGSRAQPAPPNASTQVDAGIPEPGSVYVLVREDAWLGDGVAPDNRGRVSDATDLKLGDVFAMKMLEDRGETLVVETLVGDEGFAHCYSTPRELGSSRLELVVARAQLTPATVRDVTFEFPDGTFGTVRAGVAVGPPGARRTVDQGGFGFNVPLADRDVGLKYALTGPLHDPNTTDLDGPTVPIAATLQVGGEDIVRTYDVFYTDPVETAAGTLVTVSSACSVIRAVTRKEELPPAVPFDMELSVGGGISVPFKAREGATIYWPDGRVAGKTVAEQWLGARDGVGDARTCYRLPLRPHDEKTGEMPSEGGAYLRACFDAADVTE